MLSLEAQEVPEENNQIQNQIVKSKKSDTVTVQIAKKQEFKISCHSCSPQKEIKQTEFYYEFKDGHKAYFCTQKELDEWKSTHNL